MNIPFLDLQAQYRTIKSEVDLAIRQVLDSSSYILGPQVAAFENNFAAYCGVRHCIGVASGLDALTLALKALGIGSGDEVIVPANSFVASALAVTMAGAKPVMVDCREGDFLIDPFLIKKNITKATKAVMPVHLYGRLADMDTICRIAQEYDLHVIEDAAQAHGAVRAGKKAGDFGITGCFSFYPGKNLGAYGDGGAIVTNDDALADSIRKSRNYGSIVKYHHETLGTNSRLDSLQATVLDVKLRYLDEWNMARRQRAAWYDEALRGIEGIIPPRIPISSEEHVWHLYVIRCPRRDELLEYCNRHGIMAQIHYPRAIHQQACYLDSMKNRFSAPVAEKLATEILSLPLYPELGCDQVESVADHIKRFSQSR